jgi:hypothetical protein
LKAGGISLQTSDGFFYPNGTIITSSWGGDRPDLSSIYQEEGNKDANTLLYVADQTQTTIYYYPNMTVVIEEIKTKVYYYGDWNSKTDTVSHNFYTAENGTDRISQLPTYQQLLDRNPLANCTAAANFFVNYTGEPIQSFSQYWGLANRSFPLFTSDYALYWWDYKAGYDLVLAQLGWNNTVNQEIGLTRGAATLQNKDWGTIITWKYMQSPYLPSGNEMYDQLKASYEAGAKYALVFNFAKDMNGNYGNIAGGAFSGA